MEIELRGVFGLMWLYNRVSGDAVNIVDVKDLQRSIQMILKDGILAGCDNWANALSRRSPVYTRPLW